jgi:hypothetical protein
VDEYIWMIIPSAAGNLIQASNTCQVNWNPAFNGIASLSAAGSNSCGTGEFSPALQITASPFVDLPYQHSGPGILVWPNPAERSINIKSSLHGPCILNITNALGKIILNAEYQSLTGTIAIDVTNFVSGIYLLSIENESGRQTTKILIKR